MNDAQCKLVDRFKDHLETILCFVTAHEDAFNRWAEHKNLGIYMRHGQLYPSLLGQSHTARLLKEL